MNLQGEVQHDVEQCVRCKLIAYIRRFIKSEIKELRFFFTYTLLFGLLFSAIFLSCIWLSGGIDKVAQNLKYMYFLFALFISYRVVLIVISKFTSITSISMKIAHKIKNKLLVEILIFIDFLVSLFIFLLLIKFFAVVFGLEGKNEYDVKALITGKYIMPIIMYLSYRILNSLKHKFYNRM